jgi:hypothetical protein
VVLLPQHYTASLFSRSRRKTGDLLVFVRASCALISYPYVLSYLTSTSYAKNLNVAQLESLHKRRNRDQHSGCSCTVICSQSVQHWAAGWAIGILGFDSRRGLGIFLFTPESRTALGSTQLPIQWVPGALSLGLKRPGREADHSPPSSAEVKE